MEVRANICRLLVLWVPVLLAAEVLELLSLKTSKWNSFRLLMNLERSAGVWCPVSVFLSPLMYIPVLSAGLLVYPVRALDLSNHWPGRPRGIILPMHWSVSVCIFVRMC